MMSRVEQVVHVQAWLWYFVFGLLAWYSAARAFCSFSFWHRSMGGRDEPWLWMGIGMCSACTVHTSGMAWLAFVYTTLMWRIV